MAEIQVHIDARNIDDLKATLLALAASICGAPLGYTSAIYENPEIDTGEAAQVDLADGAALVPPAPPPVDAPKTTAGGRRKKADAPAPNAPAGDPFNPPPAPDASAPRPGAGADVFSEQIKDANRLAAEEAALMGDSGEPVVAITYEALQALMRQVLTKYREAGKSAMAIAGVLESKAGAPNLTALKPENYGAAFDALQAELA